MSEIVSPYPPEAEGVVADHSAHEPSLVSAEQSLESEAISVVPSRRTVYLPGAGSMEIDDTPGASAVALASLESRMAPLAAHYRAGDIVAYYDPETSMVRVGQVYDVDSRNVVAIQTLGVQDSRLGSTSLYPTLDSIRQLTSRERDKFEYGSKLALQTELRQEWERNRGQFEDVFGITRIAAPKQEALVSESPQGHVPPAETYESRDVHSYLPPPENDLIPSSRRYTPPGDDWHTVPPSALSVENKVSDLPQDTVESSERYAPPEDE